ncbi:MAG: hypothetical protein JW717_00305 [Marinilabiliaceae bacterium]|nr:hypothetical protein [Marinilabiliaceae bacterium]
MASGKTIKRIKNLILLIITALLFIKCNNTNRINRYELVNRHNVHVTTFDTLSSLSVGNGQFAFTVDPTGLQSFPSLYKKGIPLGTMSQWGWHSFPNANNYQFEETLVPYNFRNKEELYSVQFNEPGRQKDAANYFRVNPHRLHLGYVGFEFKRDDNRIIDHNEIKDINQTLDLWNGIIKSNYTIYGDSVHVLTICHPKRDIVSTIVTSNLIPKNKVAITISLPYPTGAHSDDASDWSINNSHYSTITNQTNNSATIKHVVDSTTTYICLNWNGNARLEQQSSTKYSIIPASNNFEFTAEFLENNTQNKKLNFNVCKNESKKYWNSYWSNGAVVDFSKCTNKQAFELERRVVLSQYLTAIQCSGDIPPAETGLTYNSWFGKFHLEMHWWHSAHFALWNRSEQLTRSFDWYKNVAFNNAKAIALRQNFDGIRWMKMTDPSANEAPSKTGSMLIWQQPHFIYMAELAYRSNPNDSLLNTYKNLVFESAKFMASFVTYDSINARYIIKGAIPAQETLKASTTINPPFELSYWHYALNVAQLWNERLNLERNKQWDHIINNLSHLASKDGLYLAAESEPETYQNIRLISDHMAVLGAVGILPISPLANTDTMQNTLNWVWDNWNWDKTWGWDYPMTAMCAARIGDREKAIGMLLDNKRTNTYLANGHNYQDKRLRAYLPGNGGLLTAIALMCAGWDGCNEKNPGFPNDGTWNVQWEGLKPMP